MPKIITSSLKESFSIMWKNKPWIFLLVFLQIIFIILFFYINYVYQPKILESTKAIGDYLDKLPSDDVAIASNILHQKSVLGDDPLAITRNLNEAIKNFRLLMVYIFLLLMIFVPLMWAVSFRLTNKKFYLKYFSRLLAIILFCLGLIFLFFYLIFNISLTDVLSARLFLKYIPLVFFSAAMLHFMFISMSLAGSTELKEIVQKTLAIGIKKMHYIFVAYFINILLFVASLALLLYSVEANVFIIVLLSLILLIFDFIFTRIFLINVVEKLRDY